MIRSICLVCVVLVLVACAASTPEQPQSVKANPLFARFVPERADDFAWENDKVAFRVYGPALRESTENSGVDCWLKRVDYPIIDLWYNRALNEGKSYHEDHGEGLDNYKVGDSLGCGSSALWIDEKAVGLNTFVEWSDLEISKTQLKFTLHYKNKIGNDLYEEKKTISLNLGDRFFKVYSLFKKNGLIVPELPVVVGISAHQSAELDTAADNRWVSAWERLGDAYLGTGVILGRDFAGEVITAGKVNSSKDRHGLLLTNTNSLGALEYYSGYGWEKAGEITNRQEWLAYIGEYSKAIR